MRRPRGQKVKVTRHENHHGAWLLVTIACIPQPCAVLPTAVAGVGLHVDTTAYVF